MTDPRAVTVEVVDRFRPRTERRFVEQVVTAALDRAGRRDLSVSILLTDENEIARIHGEFLDDPTPTDVISFPMDDGVDIVVSVERARNEAQRRGHTIKAELALYLVHGVLHACGYDDIQASDRQRMRALEQEVLRDLGLHVAPVD